MKTTTNESITKNTANLDEIVNNVDELDAILNSREFITKLIDDLRNKKRNVVEWKLVDGKGTTDDIDPHSIADTFGVNYIFDFKYKFGDKIIPLSIIISGEVPFDVTPHKRGNWFTPPEGGAVTVDYKNMGSGLDLGLFDQDGSELNIKWLTPELRSSVTKEILQNYV